MNDRDNAELISTAWQNYQRSKSHWDFKNGPLRCPLPVSVGATTALDGNAGVSDGSMDVITFRRERGYFNGNPCWQIIGDLRSVKVVVAISDRNNVSDGQAPFKGDFGMSKYCKYDDLNYKPTMGFVDLRGKSREWGLPVTVEQGRAMEADGLAVMWPYAKCPAWVAKFGLSAFWMAASRIVTWPSRLG